VWDRIIRSPKYARLNVQDGKQKYEFKEITDTFRCAAFSTPLFIAPLLRADVVSQFVRSAATLRRRFRSSTTFSRGSALSVAARWCGQNL
jgi:hypothetical protein